MENTPLPYQDKALLSVRQFCEIADISRTSAYVEMGTGRLGFVKCGKRRLIPVAEVQKWIERLKVEAA